MATQHNVLHNIQSISTATSKARSQRRDDLLRYKPKPEPSGTLIPFVLTYHPELPKVKEIVNKHWPTIESSKRLNEIFPQKPVMAYRRPKSLRDILVHAKLNSDPSDDGPTGESKPCGNNRCFTCKLMTPTKLLSHPQERLWNSRGRQTANLQMSST